MKIIVAGLKLREIHEEYVNNSLRPVITITQRKDIRYCICINMFLRTENIKSILYMHFQGPVLIFPSSCTQIFHGQSGIWVQDKNWPHLKTPPSFTGLDQTDSYSALEENEHVFTFMCTRA